MGLPGSLACRADCRAHPFAGVAGGRQGPVEGGREKALRTADRPPPAPRFALDGVVRQRRAPSNPE